MGARVAIDHNSVGFGFTYHPPLGRGGRGEDLLPYGTIASATIGYALVRGKVASAYQADNRRRRDEHKVEEGGEGRGIDHKIWPGYNEDDGSSLLA